MKSARTIFRDLRLLRLSEAKACKPRCCCSQTPKGKPNPEMRLKPIAKRLEELLGRPVIMAPDCVGPEVERIIPKDGGIVLLENLRFHPEEEKNDPGFSRQLAARPVCQWKTTSPAGSLLVQK